MDRQPVAGNLSADAPDSLLKPEGSVGHRMYVMAFDLDTAILQPGAPSASWDHAFTDSRGALQPHGFFRQQGGECLGDETVDPVRGVRAVTDLAHRYEWFEPSVRDIRRLRVEECNNRVPAVRQGSSGHQSKKN